METNTYKLKFQKIKGTWTTYVFILGVGAMFLDTRLAIALILVGLALSIKFKNDPNNNSAMYYNYALTLYAKKEYNKAKTSLENAIHYKKDNKEAYFFLGCLHFDEKDYKNALVYLKRGGIEEIQDPSLVYVLGKCYYHTDDFENAIKYLSMISYDGNESMEKERLLALGFAYCESEEFELGYNALEKVKINIEEIDKDNIEYVYYYGVCAYNCDEDELAKSLLSKVYEKDRYYKYIDVYAKEFLFNTTTLTEIEDTAITTEI